MLLALCTAAEKHPQSAHTALYPSMQHEWSFIQRVLSGISGELIPVEQSITDFFIPLLFHCQSIDPLTHSLTALPVSHGGIGIFNPTAEADNNFETSRQGTSVLREALLNQTQTFIYQDHVDQMQQSRKAHHKLRDELAEITFKDLLQQTTTYVAKPPQ